MAAKLNEAAADSVGNHEMRRDFKAPLELMWRAWTEPAMLAEWWGPTGFTNPVCEIEPKSGGKFYIDMKAPNGTIYPCSGRVVEAVKPSRLVVVCGALDQNRDLLFEIENSASFSHAGGVTSVVIRTRVLRSSEEGKTYLGGNREGWSLSLARLEALLDQSTHGKGAPMPGTEPFIISRVFNAPRALVFKVHTDPAHLSQWMSPTGFEVIKAEQDFRVGGTYHYGLRSAEGHEMWGKQVYREIVEP